MRPAPLFAALLGALACTAATQPAPPAMRPVIETLYGTKVTDPWRRMEALKPATVAWIKAQGAYTRSVLDSIAPRAALLKQMGDFAAGFTGVSTVQRAGGREVLLLRAPGADDFDLVAKDSGGTRKLVDIAALREAHGGKAYAINYFLISPDGTKVAAGISAGGSEAASLTVFDAATGTPLAGPIDRAEFGLLNWNDGGTVLYFNRLHERVGGGDKYKASAIWAWNLKSAPVPLPGPQIPAAEIPQLVTSPTSPDAVTMLTNGAQTELALWQAPKARIGTAQWTSLATHDDGVIAAALLGDQIYLLSHKGAPTFQVLRVKAGEPLSHAVTILPARADRIIHSIHAASDGVYAVEGDGVYAHLLRIAGGKTDEITLPFKGDIAEAFSDSAAPGIVIAEESWTVPQCEYEYDPAARRFNDLKLCTSPAFDPAAFQVRDLQATAHDGVKVPLTLVEQKNARGPRIALLHAYGFYGISQTPHFSTALTVFEQMGGAYAICHARGGGELGEAWRLAGKDAGKPNTWNDLIACAEDLIARGVTTRDKLVLWGGSAGGITVGMAMDARPDLFAGVIDSVPAANILRLEALPGGAIETPEFGSLKTEAGFRGLLAMDTYQHVRPGVRYPPVLVTIGLNDARIAPWMPAKYAARLLAAHDPVLLRVDLDVGHGVTLTRTQGLGLFADMFAFAFWHAGEPGWRPVTAISGRP